MPFFVVFVASELIETDLVNFVNRFLAPGAGCSKLMKSLVNVSLKFKILTFQICLDFLLEKCEDLLHCKRFSHFSNKK